MANLGDIIKRIGESNKIYKDIINPFIIYSIKNGKFDSENLKDFQTTNKLITVDQWISKKETFTIEILKKYIVENNEIFKTNISKISYQLLYNKLITSDILLRTNTNQIIIDKWINSIKTKKKIKLFDVVYYKYENKKRISYTVPVNLTFDLDGDDIFFININHKEVSSSIIEKDLENHLSYNYLKKENLVFI